MLKRCFGPFLLYSYGIQCDFMHTWVLKTRPIKENTNYLFKPNGIKNHLEKRPSIGLNFLEQSQLSHIPFYDKSLVFFFGLFCFVILNTVFCLNQLLRLVEGVFQADIQLYTISIDSTYLNGCDKTRYCVILSKVQIWD